MKDLLFKSLIDSKVDHVTSDENHLPFHFLFISKIPAMFTFHVR
jgi:hypothetical protein